MKVKDKKRKKKMGMIIACVLSCFIIIVIIMIPPSKGEIKPLLDELGNIRENSISEKTFVEVNDTTLGMIIIGEDISNPVLLFLGGGPGIPEYFMEQKYSSKLESEFTVCYLDYRGTALSYSSKTSFESMNTRQYIDDVVEVTKYLCERFDQEKVYLLAHSFGTYIALNTVYQYPQYYHAYIAMAQMADRNKAELLSYKYMYEEYQKQGNSNMIKQFDKYPVETDKEALSDYSLSFLRDKAMHELGVGTTRDMKSVISGILFPSLRYKVYTPIERINIWRGKIFAHKTPVETESLAFNAFEEIKEITVPVYFFAGIYDYTVCHLVQKEYYEHLKAPYKAFYIFNDSAHSPLYEEPEKALTILCEDVINGSKALSAE